MGWCNRNDCCGTMMKMEWCGNVMMVVGVDAAVLADDNAFVMVVDTVVDSIVVVVVVVD